MTMDISEQLQAQVIAAAENQTPLFIQGGNSKAFYGRQVEGQVLSTQQHQGILSYEPTELVITARAGTPLTVIEQTLAEQNQMLPFEPPAFGDQATLGGTIACNFSGPRRAYTGAARDFVLGTHILNGKGEILSFGGEVMKNVAGYDVSRLMTGAMGSLGVILDVSLKVLPRPDMEITLAQELDLADALSKLQSWARKPLPISASCFYNNTLYIRLSATAEAVTAAKTVIGGDELEVGNAFWHSIKEQSHDFFADSRSLWRLSIDANAPALTIAGNYLYEWGGALRWLLSDETADSIQHAAAELGGHATLFRTPSHRDAVFQALPAPLMQLHLKLKQAFDPKGILNPGRMYREL